MLLVTFDFFHVFVKEISLRWRFSGEMDKGSSLLAAQLPCWTLEKDRSLLSLLESRVG